MLNHTHIGHEFAPYTVEVEKGRLRFFAKATRQSDPAYLDEAAARWAGYRSLPAPPTFLGCLEMESPGSRQLCALMDLDIGQLLHGEQHFDFRAVAVAGDSLTFYSRITDIYEKKGGALGFIAIETRVTDQHGMRVADLRRLVVVRLRGGHRTRISPPRFARVPSGCELPWFTGDPVSRLGLALYAVASGDHNPIHIDLDFARRAGMSDVFAHGMLGMAHLGHVLTKWSPQAALRSYGVRFVAITHLGDALTFGGRVTDEFEAEGERRVRVHLSAANAAGEIKLNGEAVIALA
ncbi:MAG TPA: MaoC family dehydratase N-terminal domain-containing protein [Burkholderiaceae bacterium]|nr:MaoC family dehydratase N-terminal domain-containing protein [Burkholderiaceae bacterium]